MNPALVVLGFGAAGAAALGLLLPSGSEGRLRAAAAAAGVLVVGLLLLPALRIPTGIPSPSGMLQRLAPWQEASSQASGSPQLNDVTFQIEPWLLFIRRELRAGAWPLWNPHQFAGSPFWANGQAAPLFPLHLAFAAMPIGLGFSVLPMARLLVAGAGVWVLARALGRSGLASFLAGASFALSGMLVNYLLFPMGNALALVPWVFWATERLTTGTRCTAIARLAAAVTLQLLSGHPETAVHSALLSGLYLAVRAERSSATLGVLTRWVAGWILGFGIAALYLLPFLALLPETLRWQLETPRTDVPLALRFELPLRLVLPDLYGSPADGTWRGPYNDPGTAVYVGALALPLAVAGTALCARGRLGHRPCRAVLAVLVFSFLAAYQWPFVREVVARLPVVGRAQPHRLLFGVELGLALLAASGLDEWRAGHGRGLLFGSAAVVGLVALAWCLRRKEWVESGLLGHQAARSAIAVALAVALVLALALDQKWRRRLVWAIPGLAVLDLVGAHGAIPGALPAERLFPRTGAIEFLAAAKGRVAAVDFALRPNAATVYGLEDVRGDDPMKLARYERAYEPLAREPTDAADRVSFRPLETWSSPWLDELGVRWVLTGPGHESPGGWRLAYQGPDARVFERSEDRPLVTSDAGRDAVRAASRSAAGWVIEVETDRPITLAVAQTWAPGWTALVEGAANPLAMSQPGAGMEFAVPAGARRVDLVYRPPALLAGLALSAVSLSLLVALFGQALGRG